MSDKNPRQFFRHYFTNGDYEDFGVQYEKGEPVYTKFRPELEGRPAAHIKDIILFREVLPDEPDYKALCEQLMGALKETHDAMWDLAMFVACLQTSNKLYERDFEWANRVLRPANKLEKALEHVKKVMGDT